jgi:YD repeat-containing protein
MLPCFKAPESREQFFPLAAALAMLENHDGENAVGSEKPHQGIFCEKRALHRGITWCNSTTALGLRGLVLETRVRSPCTHDNMGRLLGTNTKYTFLPGRTFPNNYGYDAASNRTSLLAPDGSTNTYAYDTQNRLSTLTNSLTGQFGLGYDALSRRTRRRVRTA